MKLDNYIKEVEEEFEKTYVWENTEMRYTAHYQLAYERLLFTAPDSVLNFLASKIIEAWEGGVNAMAQSYATKGHIVQKDIDGLTQARKKWLLIEDDLIINSEMSHKEIALLTNRSVKAVESRARRLRLTQPKERERVKMIKETNSIVNTFKSNLVNFNDETALEILTNDIYQTLVKNAVKIMVLTKLSAKPTK